MTNSRCAEAEGASFLLFCSLWELQVLHEHIPLGPIHGHIGHGELLGQGRVGGEHQVVRGRHLELERLVGSWERELWLERIHWERESRVEAPVLRIRLLRGSIGR